MEEHLPNDDLIRKLCAQYDKALYMENDSTETDAQGKHIVTSGFKKLPFDMLPIT